MSKEQLIHIFDDSVCLTRRQMKDYVNGVMTNEESHAVEIHLCACAFCNDAIEGLFAQKEGNAVGILNMLDNDFLKDYLSYHHPQVHLNAMAAAHPNPHAHVYKRRRRFKGKAQPVWRMSSLAAVLLIGFGLLWYARYGKHRIHNDGNDMLAQRTAPQIVSSSATGIANGRAQKQAMEEPLIASAIPQQQGAVVQQSDAPVSPALPEVGPPPAATNASDVLASAVTAPAEKPVMQDQHSEDNALSKSMVATSALKSAEIVRQKNLQADADINKDEAQQRAFTGDVNIAEKFAANAPFDNLENADNLFAQQKYSAALKSYEKEISSGSKSKSQHAILQSAKCYLALGNTARATVLLEKLVNEGSGFQKREAKRMLKQLSNTGQ